MNLTWLEWIVLMPNSLVVRRWFFLHQKRQTSCRSRTPSASYNKICAMNLTNMNAIRLTTDEYSIHATSICGSRWQLDVNSYAMQSQFEYPFIQPSMTSSVLLMRWICVASITSIHLFEYATKMVYANKRTEKCWPRWFLSNQCQHAKG